MLERKPGRILFWVSLITGALGWVYAFISQANGHRADLSLSALFCWFIAFWTGVFWLKLKWAQAKARAMATAWADSRGTPAQLDNGTVMQPRGRAGKFMAGAGIAIAVGLTALLIYSAVIADKIPISPPRSFATTAPATTGQAPRKHRKAHAKPQQPTPAEPDMPQN